MLNEDIELKSSDIDSTSTEEVINVGNNSERKAIKEKDDIKLLYGNNINIREPKKIGNISAFLYTITSFSKRPLTPPPIRNGCQ